MKILIVNNAEKEVADFVAPIEHLLNENSIEFSTIQYSDLTNTELEDFDGIILSASPRGDDIVDSHQKLYQWVKSSHIPILGICAGHQIIGKLYGSELIRDKEKEIGDLNVEIIKEDKIFFGYDKIFLVKQNHHDSVTLPEDFILLAKSEKCANQIMKHKTKPIYTTQFHAEILNEKLILNFIKLVQKS